MASDKKKEQRRKKRQRQRRRRRRRNRGRFSFLLKGLTILAVLAAMTMGATVFFQLEKVEIKGNHRYEAREIEEISGLIPGDNLFRINKYDIRRELLQALPYVEDVHITRRLPSTIRIEIEEWDAAARIPVSLSSLEETGEESEVEKPAAEEPAAAEPEESAEADGQEPSAEDTENGDEGGEEQTPPLLQEEAPGQLWLMSVGGRMLEPASADSPGILIKGVYALAPRAGTQLAVAEEQQNKCNALLQLLAALEEHGMMQQISEIDLTSSTEIVLYYDGRFLVKLPLSGDFDYCLHAMEEVVEQRAANETGTMDLTRKDYAVVYSPYQ